MWDWLDISFEFIGNLLATCILFIWKYFSYILIFIGRCLEVILLIVVNWTLLCFAAVLAAFALGCIGYPIYIIWKGFIGGRPKHRMAKVSKSQKRLLPTSNTPGLAPLDDVMAYGTVSDDSSEQFSSPAPSYRSQKSGKSERFAQSFEPPSYR